MRDEDSAEPSPKFQLYATVPLQLLGVAEAVNDTAVPTVPVVGAEAVKLSEHVEVVALTTMLPVFLLETPAMVAVIDHWKVPAAE